MRDRQVIESELRLIAAIRRTGTEVGMPMPTITVADELLNEWQQSAANELHLVQLTCNSTPGDHAGAGH